MSQKKIPLTQEQLAKIITQYPTPFHIYDEKGIRENARNLKAAFDWVPGGFKNYFAVKALPNPYILNILKEEGMGADCSSLPEVILSEKAGLTGEEIIFTSNDTPATEFIEAKKAGAILNLDDFSHIDFIEKTAGGLPELICFRYNPGSLKEGNTIIGNPQDAKYGFTRQQLIDGYKKAQKLGVKRFGLHTMVASNELNYQYFIETARILFELVVEIKKTTGITIEFVNLGGGIGIPYKEEQKIVDLTALSQGVREQYEKLIIPAGLDGLKIVMECGRMVTGPFGYLISTVLHRKETYKTFVGLDACMANLMRPALYGAYHHITVVGKENSTTKEVCDITGSLCENNDKFAIDREVSKLEIGDTIVIHDTGAHGHAMGFNYNGKLRSAELLLKEDGSVQQIRRAETIADYFATLDFTDLA